MKHLILSALFLLCLTAVAQKKEQSKPKEDTTVVTHEPIELSQFQITEINQAKAKLDSAEVRYRRANDQYQLSIWRPIDANATRLKIDRAKIVQVDQVSKPGFLIVKTGNPKPSPSTIAGSTITK